MNGNLFLDFQKFSVYYGSFAAVNTFHLTVPEGIIGLLGPNGAGKTSLIKGLLGLIPSTKGNVFIYQRSIKDKMIRQRIGYMPEDDTLISGLNAVAFVTYMGVLAGMSRIEARKRAHVVLSYVGIGEMRYRKIDTLSKGNHQRLKLAAALVHDPDALFLDEPTSGLDPKGHADMLKLIREIGKSGKDMLISSHLVNEIERVCQQIMVIQDGKLKKYERIDNLKEGQSLVYRVSIRGDGETFLALLKKRGVALLARDGNHFTVQLADEAVKPALFQACLAQEIQIRVFIPQEHTLQEALMDIIDAG